ncbi:MAG: hypothetical protein K0S98_1204 [Propionibacteriaceae bacterium]|nr:hypothetical protein [Propionibacteriaceae bacterium]
MKRARVSCGLLALVETVGVEPVRSRFKAEALRAAVPGPGFRPRQQRMPDPLRAAVRSDREILDPGPLAEPDGHQIQVNRCEANQPLILLRHEHGGSVTANGGLESISGHRHRPIGRLLAWRNEQPFVQGGDTGTFTGTGRTNADVQ